MTFVSDFENISIDFQKADTFYPQNAYLEYGRNQYSFLEANVNSDTASKMANDENLLEKQYAIVKIGGIPVQRMYFRPEFATFGPKSEDYKFAGKIELHDAHQSLESGKVTFVSDTDVSLEEVFQNIFNSRRNKEVITDIDTSKVNKKISVDVDSGSEAGIINFSGFIPGWKNDFLDLLDNAFEIDNKTPFKALEAAKKKFGVTTRVTPDGVLEVGNYKGGDKYTASSRGYNTDLHLKSSSVASPTQNIEAIKIKGPTKSLAPKGVGLDDIDKYFDIFSNDSLKEDYRINVTVSNPEKSGIIKEYDIKDVELDEEKLVDIAKRYYRDGEIKTNSGKITTNINTSNFSFENKAFKVGDVVDIKTAPTNSIQNYSTFPSGKHLLKQIQYNIGTSWDVSFDIVKPLTNLDNLNVSIEYYNTRQDRTLTYEEMNGYSYGNRPETEVLMA